MSSGEADVITFTVNGNHTYPTIGDDWWKTSSTYSNVYWSTSPVYYYQITCPKCNTLNWAEVDRIITCKGETQARNNRKVPCGARIKAVLEQVDFEVPVTKP